MGGIKTKKCEHVKAEIEIWLPRKVMKAVYQSLLPETGLPSTKVELRKNKTLLMKIQSADLSTLRATLNSLLRWANVAMEVVKGG